MITGFAFAIYYKTPDYQKFLKYDWQKPDYNPEEDKFMQRFDQNGNFVNLPPPEPEPEIDMVTEIPQIRYVYQFIPEKKEEKSE
ncbi:hypothetical protein [Flavobacterium sp. 3HN19-14]|uniref:hypothetical protein n=1 Tax=Flavobacterium sp. 3HN19-14 TaxID=3448133 RepID=UPI003EE33888